MHSPLLILIELYARRDLRRHPDPNSGANSTSSAGTRKVSWSLSSKGACKVELLRRPSEVFRLGGCGDWICRMLHVPGNLLGRPQVTDPQ